MATFGTVYRTYNGQDGNGQTDAEWDDRVKVSADQYRLGGNNADTIFKNNQAAWDAYNSGDVAGFEAALGKAKTYPDAASRYTQGFGVNTGSLTQPDTSTAVAPTTIPGVPTFSGVTGSSSAAQGKTGSAAVDNSSGALAIPGSTSPSSPLAPLTVAPAPAATGALPTGVAGAATYVPSDSALVSRQLANLLAGDSSYIQRARMKAAEYANTHGGLNSSIAAGAGEAAAIDAALPIAQADAGVNAAAQRDNTSAQNQFNTAGNQFVYQGALATQNAGITTARDAALFSNDLQRIQAQTASQLQILDKQQGTSLYSSYRTASEGIQNDYATAVQAIQTSDMDADVKSAQIANLQALTVARQNFLSTIYSNSPGWSAEWAQFVVNTPKP